MVSEPSQSSFITWFCFVIHLLHSILILIDQFWAPMVSIKKIPHRTTRNSSRSNVVPRSPPGSPSVAVDSPIDTSHPKNKIRFIYSVCFVHESLRSFRFTNYNSSPFNSMVLTMMIGVLRWKLIFFSLTFQFSNNVSGFWSVFSLSTIFKAFMANS